MLDVRLDLTRWVLASREMLAALRTWTDEGNALRSLDDSLTSAAATFAVQGAQRYHFHQATNAFGRLGALGPDDDSHIAGPTVRRGAGPPGGVMSGPWFLRCLMELAERLLCEDRGRVAFRWETLELAQEALRILEPTQLVAAFFARRRCRRMLTVADSQDRAETRSWARDGILPPVACTMLSSLGQRGLAETHRHMNISLQPVLMWGKLMESDVLPSRIDNDVREWLTVAQRLRPRLAKCLCCSSSELLGAAPPAFPLNLRVLLRSEPLYQGTPLEATHVCWCIEPGSAEPSSSVFERELLLRVFELLIEAPTDAFAAAVHAYCVLQNLVYRTLVMPIQGGDGLDRFTKLFAAHPLREQVDHECAERLVSAHRAGCVRWLEARMTPGRSVSKRVYDLRDSFARRMEGVGQLGLFDSDQAPANTILGEQLPQSALSLPAVGLVLHFVKRERSRAAKDTAGLKCGCGATPGQTGCCSESHGKPSTSTGHSLGVQQAREQQCRSEAWSQVEQIAQTMAEDPLVARLIVGFDVCGSEAATEMGTYAAHLRYLRRLGRPVPEALSAANPAPESWYRSARTYLTCHAGEDFDHLLGGLRHIDEALEFYDLAQGDRIGHGTALGLSPAAWMQRLGETCWVRRGEWLDDLVWFHAWLTWCGEETAVAHDVAGRIEELSREVYDHPVSPAVLLGAWRLRCEDPGEPFPSRSLGRRSFSALSDIHLLGGRLFARESLRQHVSSLATRGSYRIWRRYHADCSVQKHWDESLGVALEPEWTTAIARVQSALTEKLVARRIAIEINPSSNLTIGPLERLVEHPVFRWLDPRKDLAGAKCPQIVVGTDDPSTFATELLHEYAFLARAAQELGATERQIEGWLEHLRQAGMSLSFLPTESFNGTGSQS